MAITSQIFPKDFVHFGLFDILAISLTFRPFFIFWSEWQLHQPLEYLPRILYILVFLIFWPFLIFWSVWQLHRPLGSFPTKDLKRLFSFALSQEQH